MYIGLDIGGTKIITAAAKADGKILRKAQVNTPVGLEEGLELLNRMIESVRGGETIEAIGVGIGGPLDYKSGVVSPLHQPKWRDIPLAKILQEKWGCRISLDVDTNISALGEYASLEHKPERLLYLTISTGMGGGFLVSGQIYRGRNDTHPEVAHQSIPYKCSYPENISCECGLQDCLEGLISGNAIRRIYGKAAEHLDKKEWGEVAYNLGQGLRNITTILAPDIIILGGGVSIGRGQKLLEAAEEVMQSHLRLVPPPEIRLSQLGYFTTLHGAVHASIHGVQ